jgi:hypothetical protein
MGAHGQPARSATSPAAGITSAIKQKNIEAGAAEIAGHGQGNSETTSHHPTVNGDAVRPVPVLRRLLECRAGHDMATGQELNYNTGASALDMALEIFGAGTMVVDATYTGWSQSSAIFTGGDSIAPGATPSDSGVILSTGRATNYTQSNGDPNRSASTSTNTSGAQQRPAC